MEKQDTLILIFLVILILAKYFISEHKSSSNENFMQFSSSSSGRASRGGNTMRASSRINVRSLSPNAYSSTNSQRTGLTRANMAQNRNMQNKNIQNQRGVQPRFAKGFVKGLKTGAKAGFVAGTSLNNTNLSDGSITYDNQINYQDLVANAYLPYQNPNYILPENVMLEQEQEQQLD